MVGTRRLFAIRTGPYVEIRSAKTPPTSKLTKLNLTYMHRTICLKQTIWLGGRVLGACKWTELLRRIKPEKLKLGPNQLIELPPHLHTLALGGSP